MPTIVGYHDITKGRDHWLRSPKRQELFGPLGVTNIRTFVDQQNPKRVAVMMDGLDENHQCLGHHAIVTSRVQGGAGHTTAEDCSVSS